MMHLQAMAPELMAPAGSWPALTAAIRSGANSIYFGVGDLNMRARASQAFTIKDLSKISRLCSHTGVKSYLTLNTILYDGDMHAMRELCDTAHSAGISAIIAADVAAMEYARQIGLAVHISVQANITNLAAVRHYARFADVMVLGRELTLTQIQKIAKGIHTENICGPNGELVRLELFVHGALCVAISGTCGMSLALFDQSANRGACLQPCRRAYRVTDEETGDELVIDNQYVMSPKDICLVEHLDKVLDAGISVLKIEGRGRDPNYVHTVTSVYREAIIAAQSGISASPEQQEQWKNRLAEVYNRGFWSGGYYCGIKLGEWSASGHTQATTMRVHVGHITNWFRKAGVAEIELNQKSIRLGDTLLIEGPTTGILQQSVSSIRQNEVDTSTAAPGRDITIPVERKVRRHDKVFLLLPRDDNRCYTRG